MPGFTTPGLAVAARPFKAAALDDLMDCVAEMDFYWIPILGIIIPNMGVVKVAALFGVETWSQRKQSTNSSTGVAFGTQKACKAR